MMKFGKDLISCNDILHEIFDTVIQKYETEKSLYHSNSNLHEILIQDIDDLSVLDKIYDEVSNEFETTIATNKYNI